MFAVGKGQIEAGLSLGFPYRKVLSQIVIPQAVRSVIPPLGSLVDRDDQELGDHRVALALADDLLKEARLINSRTFQTNEVFFWAAVGYSDPHGERDLRRPLSRTAARRPAMKEKG